MAPVLGLVHLQTRTLWLSALKPIDGGGLTPTSDNRPQFPDTSGNLSALL